MTPEATQAQRPSRLLEATQPESGRPAELLGPRPDAALTPFSLECKVGAQEWSKEGKEQDKRTLCACAP